MELKVETLDPCRRKMKIAIPAESVDREIELAYGRIARSAQVAGFRQGKAPRKILELHYGPRLRDEVKEKLVDESFAAALKEKGIEPAIPPSLDVKGLNISPGEPFRYEVEVEVWPELHVSGYSGIKAMRKKVAVSDEEVERSIAALLDQHAEFIPVEGRPLAAGDFAMLDFSGAVGGTVFDGRTGVWLEVAPQTYIPGFCGAIAGMNREETRSFTLTLPDDVKPEDLRGKEASFNVTLHEIKQKKVPELNDEFCKELGNYAGVKELRDAVRNDLLAYAEAEESRNVLEQINTYLLEHLTVPLPQRRLNAETASLAEKTAARLLSQGVKKEEIVEKKEELLAAARKQAERNLRLACIYEEVAKRERITVSPEEVEERLKRIAAGLKRDLEQVRAAMEREGGISALRKEIESDRVAEFLMKNARIKEAKNP